MFKVLLFGSGALGSVFSWRLQESGKAQVTAVCRSNYEAVSRSGFRISSQAYGDHVYRPSRVVRSVEEAVDNGAIYDFIVVCTKALPNLGDNSGLIASAVTKGTVIVLIQNGIGIEDPFMARYPDSAVASVVAYIDVTQPEDGVIEHGSSAVLTMGPPSPRLEELAQAWRDGGVACSVAENIQALRWLKLAWNASLNTVSVVSGGNDTRKMFDDAECRQLILRLMGEVFRLGAAATGAPLPVVRGIDGPEALVADVDRPGEGVVPSMLMDFWAKRPLEHAVILGRPIEIARGLGVDVPCMQTVYAILKMVEKQYLAD
ncbi:hypothetical protein IWW37_004695 [Coemansia sp. RSA 2050]|nr:hypothetical protein IWW37_004695 [Coemansia sp. RSA 2050]KAJ2735228.1 hypothetical protein IW152_001747 [Coemansia sp. BCRC 34962]